MQVVKLHCVTLFYNTFASVGITFFPSKFSGQPRSYAREIDVTLSSINQKLKQQLTINLDVDGHVYQ